MPTRRTTLLGLGVLTAGGAGAAATGAFTAATAERTVTVSTANETDAILAFQPTSTHASITDNGAGELQVAFSDLNANANFTFEDTFIVLNNSSETVSLTSVGSGDGESPNWLNEEDSETATSNIGVLIGSSENTWQGNPNQDYIGDEVDPTVDGNTDGGYYDFGENSYTSGDISLSPPGESEDFGDWVSIGFQFGTSDSIGNWDASEFPGTLQFEFSQDTS